MRLRASSSHARITAAVPAVKDDAGARTTAPPPESRDERPKRRLPKPTAPGVATGAILAAIVGFGLYVRLRNNSYGLPYVYNYDEANHFVNHSVAMLHGGLDPGYYQNPSGFTYIVYLLLRVVYGILGVHLSEGTIVRQFAFDPTPIWHLARSAAAFIAMIGVVATFVTARRFYGARVALVAAALLTFAFLPVTYSRIAVTDVGTFFGVAVALYGAFRVHEGGGPRWYAVAGIGTGLACGFKYTAGLAILPLVVAAAVRIWRDRGTPWLKRRDLRFLVLAGIALAVAFGITTPYFFVHPHRALYQIKTQAQAAGDTAKLGQSQQGGISYYLSSFTWGFGWAAVAFALLGAAIEARRDRVRGVMLAIFPLALFAYMGIQTRYFGRWLLPEYPVLAILGGIGVVRTAELVRGRHAWAISGALVAVLAALVLIQPVAADVRTMNVLGREDTRQVARDYLVAHLPRSARVVIEPAVPDNYYRVAGAHTPTRQFVRGFVQDIRRQQLLDAPLGADTTYAATLTPQNIDSYRSQGFCYVVTMSLIRGRAENAQVPQALAYYHRLVRNSQLLFSVSPFKKGRKPVPLHYDFSYDYYPTAYARPGAIVDVYRLNGCREQTGRVPSRPFGDTGLQKGIGTSFLPGP